MARHEYGTKGAAGSFSSAFGLSSGCLLGIASAFFVVFAGILLACAGCTGGCLFLGGKAQKEIQRKEELERQNPSEAATIRWGDAAKIDTLRVRIKSVSLTTYSGSSPAGRVYTSSSPGLVAIVQTETTDGTKEYSAKGAVKTAQLKDSLGNSISGMRLKTEFGFSCPIHDQLEGGVSYVVRSDKPLTDTLVFDNPVPAATVLFLKLDAKDYGGRGDLTFEIPESEWKPKPPESKKKK